MGQDNDTLGPWPCEICEGDHYTERHEFRDGSLAYVGGRVERYEGDVRPVFAYDIISAYPDTSGIPRPIDVQPTSPTVSVPDLTTPELAALMIAGQEPDAVGCAKCGRSMDWHPAVCFECIEYPGRYEYCSHPLACESYIDPDFNAYQDSDDE